MAIGFTDSDIYQNLAEQIRRVTGTMKKMTPSEMVTALTKSNIIVRSDSALTRFENNKWYIRKNASVHGLQFIPNELEAGQAYKFSFKFQKASGNLYSIGGHDLAYQVTKMVLDGVQLDLAQYDYTAGIAVNNDDTEHSFEYTGIFLGQAPNPSESNYFYIQPNRLRSDTLNFYLWDFKVEPVELEESVDVESLLNIASLEEPIEGSEQ